MATNKKSDHADKGSVRVPLTRQNACVLYEASFFIKLIPAYKIKLPPSVKQVPLSPFPRKRAPRRLPPAGGTSRSRSARAFSYCVTRFRGAALRHAKYPKTSYCLQLLDTRLHGRCVNPDHICGRGLIFLSSKMLVLFWQNASVLSK